MQRKHVRGLTNPLDYRLQSFLKTHATQGDKIYTDLRSDHGIIFKEGL